MASIVILVISRTELKLRSPLAVNSVAKGGSSALFTVSSNSPSVVNAISSTRASPPVESVALRADALGALRSNTLSVLSPSPA